jgi:hypothetical protein
MFWVDQLNKTLRKHPQGSIFQQQQQHKKKRSCVAHFEQNVRLRSTKIFG